MWGSGLSSFRLTTPLRSGEMLQTAKKTVWLGLAACIAALLSPFSGVAAAEGLPNGTLPQPQGLNYAGIYALRQIDPNLTGAGVKFAVIARSITYTDGQPQNDYQPNINHNCFKPAHFTLYNQSANGGTGISPHATAICSILFGEDSAAFNPDLGQFYYQGVAPAANAGVYEFWSFLTNNVFPQSPPDANIVSASIGTQFEDWWTRGIESLAEHYGLIVVAGIGNGYNAYDPPLYPGAAPNVIGVGVVNSVNSGNLGTTLANFALAYPENSSFGPTAAGRCKPDIVAPGNCLAAGATDPKRYEPTGNWSSFSTPVVAGTAGLLMQKAKQNPGLKMAVAPAGGNCVIKAILLNSATKLPFWHKGRLAKDDDHSAPLDYLQGAGMLNALAAYRHLIAGQNKPGNVPTVGWDNNLLNKTETPENSYRITVAEPANKLITVTAVWNRHYNTTYPFQSRPDRDTNLRIELWATDSNDPNNNQLLDYSDSQVDNTEHIYCRTDPNYTNYEIVVAFSDNQNQTAATERYGLAWNVSSETQYDSIFWYDLNADGVVNESDFAILINNLANSRQSPESCALGDINADGAIDGKDMEILVSHINSKADWQTKQENQTQ